MHGDCWYWLSRLVQWNAWRLLVLFGQTSSVECMETVGLVGQTSSVECMETVGIGRTD